MKPEWIPVYLILGFLLFQAVMKISYPFWVLLHELGHAIPAKLGGKQGIRIQIGVAPIRFRINCCGIPVEVGQKELSSGFTTYDGSPNSTWEAGLIILSAPLLSMGISILTALLIRHNLSSLNLLTSVISSALWLASFHITFSAWWPFANPRSDLLQFINHIRNVR